MYVCYLYVQLKHNLNALGWYENSMFLFRYIFQCWNCEIFCFSVTIITHRFSWFAVIGYQMTARTKPNARGVFWYNKTTKKTKSGYDTCWLPGQNVLVSFIIPGVKMSDCCWTCTITGNTMRVFEFRYMFWIQEHHE